MYHLVAAERQRVTVEVIGMAASGASLLAVAGRECVVYRGCRMMIHDPVVWMGGRAAELRKTADEMDAWAVDLSEIYGARSKMTAAEALAAMREETWYTSEEAVEVGLADRVGESPPKLADPPDGVDEMPEDPEEAVIVAVSMVAGGTGPWRGLYRRLPEELQVTDTGRMDNGNEGGAGAGPATGPSLIEQVRALSADDHRELATALGMVPKSEHETVTARLGDYEKVNKGLRKDLDTVQEERTTERADAAVERFLAAGQVRVADRDFWLGRLKEDFDSTSKFLAEQPKRPGFGGVRGSSHGGDVQENEAAEVALSDEEKEVARTLGLTDDEYRRFGAEGDARSIASATADMREAPASGAGPNNAGGGE